MKQKSLFPFLLVYLILTSCTNQNKNIQKYPKISKSTLFQYFIEIPYVSIIDLKLKPVKSIPHHHVTKIVNEFIQTDCEYFITGSWRRECKKVSDIDLVMYKCDINKILNIKII